MTKQGAESRIATRCRVRWEAFSTLISQPSTGFLTLEYQLPEYDDVSNFTVYYL